MRVWVLNAACLPVNTLSFIKMLPSGQVVGVRTPTQASASNDPAASRSCELNQILLKFIK